jgi:hypothetical protein
MKQPSSGNLRNLSRAARLYLLMQKRLVGDEPFPNFGFTEVIQAEKSRQASVYPLAPRTF